MPSTRDTQARFTAVLFGIAACCLLWELVHLRDWLPVVTSDARVYYLVWYDELLRMGRFHGISGAYANYTPPTLYLFSLASLFEKLADKVVLLKLINVPFLAVSGWLGFRIATLLQADRMRAAAVACVILVLPEVWQNAFHWGQYDLLYTTFLLGTVYALLRRNSPLAMCCYGSALAFKLQALFMAPALLALLLTGELAVPWLLLIPVVSLLWMVPAALAGRSWQDLFAIYRDQSGQYVNLSVDAPNLYYLFQERIPYGHRLDQASRLANVITLLAIGWMVWRYLASHRSVERRSSAEDVVLLIAFSQLAIPYLLPHMHERYYFAGNVFTALLLAGRPAFLLPVVLLQAGILATYHQYFRTEAVALTVHDLLFAIVAVTAGVLLMTWLYWQQTRPPLLRAEERNGPALAATL